MAACSFGADKPFDPFGSSAATAFGAANTAQNDPFAPASTSHVNTIDNSWASFGSAAAPASTKYGQPFLRRLTRTYLQPLKPGPHCSPTCALRQTDPQWSGAVECARCNALSTGFALRMRMRMLSAC